MPLSRAGLLTSTHTVTVSGRALVLVDTLIALALGAAFLQSLWLWAIGEHVASNVLLGLVPTIAVLWILRRRRPHWAPVIRIPFVVLAIGASFAGDGVLATLLLMVALLLQVLDFGPIAGLLTIVVMACLQAIVMTSIGRPPGTTALQTSLTALLLLFGMLFALLLRQAEQGRLENERLLAQVDETNRQLVRANEALRHSIAVEKELVLADERARSARDLHDGLGQRLTLTQMSLEFVERTWTHDPDRALAEVRTARETTQEAMATMRLWVRALNPPRLVGGHGAAAFDDIAEAFRGTGLVVDVTVTGTERPLPQDISLVAYRFVQEGLTNALKHAHPHRVTLTVTYAEADVRLRLADDGGPLTSPPVEGFGLRSLRDRAQACGGDLTVTPEPAGLAVSVRLPLIAETTADAIANPSSAAGPDTARSETASSQTASPQTASSDTPRSVTASSGTAHSDTAHSDSVHSGTGRSHTGRATHAAAARR